MRELGSLEITVISGGREDVSPPPGSVIFGLYRYAKTSYFDTDSTIVEKVFTIGLCIVAAMALMCFGLDDKEAAKQQILLD